MAGVSTVTASPTAVCRRLLVLPQCSYSVKPYFSSFSSSKLYSSLGWISLRRGGATVLPSRKLAIRAARTESKGVSLGFRAPDFELREPLTGKLWKLSDFEDHPALLVMFICNHCPFVKHLKKDIKGVAVIAISSNSVTTHPQDGPEFMAEDAELFNYPFPYLYDESQDVARNFGAVCTLEFFLFKKDGRRPFELVYHGQFDDSRPSKNVRVTGRDLSLAIDAVLSGKPVPANQKPSASNQKGYIKENYLFKVKGLDGLFGAFAFRDECQVRVYRLLEELKRWNLVEDFGDRELYLSSFSSTRLVLKPRPTRSDCPNF
ncbi:thioredoxin superfamily protein [Striga asiatica]|uniref:Thioredoxin superfamily protein n=1 Tax=Striga asiatica TaxID=4170 RepID=A0A5A7PYQ2_STRAF|nr:thioredoxin superfamily protein [Striga asiatica]